jgi:hypothetical protein
MAEGRQSSGRKWRRIENDGDGNTYFDNFRFTPFTTDLKFFRDPKIYETDVPRTTQDSNANPGSSSENHRSNERMK